MDLGLRGCAALVSGSSSGMGLAAARALAAEGCHVALFARRAEVLEAEAARLEAEHGVRALPLPGDSRDAAAVEAAVDRAVGELGRLDVLVNNTGGPPGGSFDAHDDAAWQDAFELTVQSALRMTRRALPALRASGRGRIVTITSSTVKEVYDGLTLANALRAAVTGWAKDLSRAEGPNGITVNCVAPGFVDTERLKYLYSLGADPEADRRADAEAIPARRFAEPEEVASVIAFLCSTQAAYVNGITVLVDGGLSRSLLA